MIIEIDLTPGEFRGMPASALANIHITELTDWSTKHNIQIHYMKRKNTITVWFNDDQTYSFFSLTFDPHPVYNTQFNVLIEDYKCPWRIVSDKNPPQAYVVPPIEEPVVYDIVQLADIKKSLTIVSNFTK